MPVLTEPPSMGELLKYEVNPNYTREEVNLLQGMPYPVGSVLGRITASGKYKLAISGGTDGAETTTAVLLIAVDATRDKSWRRESLDLSVVSVIRALRTAASATSHKRDRTTEVLPQGNVMTNPMKMLRHIWAGQKRPYLIIPL